MATLMPNPAATNLDIIINKIKKEERERERKREREREREGVKLQEGEEWWCWGWEEVRVGGGIMLGPG